MQKNKPIGWIINEAADEPIMEKPKIIETAGRRVLAEGILQRANSKNRNARFYDDKDLFPELVSRRSKEMLKTGFGSENGHPMSKDLTRQQTIDPNNVVAYFTELWTEGDFVWGRFRGSNLAIGEAFDQDLRDGFSPAWSLRALGSIVNTNRGAEVKNLKVITWDRVFYPSHPEAYTKGIVSESATDSGIILPRTPKPNNSNSMIHEGMVEPIMNQSVLDYIALESANLKNIVKMFEPFYNGIELVNENTQVRLVDKEHGNVYIIALEDHVYNEIINYCNK